MVRKLVWTCMLSMVAICSSPAWAGFEFSVVNPSGGAPTPGFDRPEGVSETFQIFLRSDSATDALGGVQFGLRLGDGVGGGVEPGIVSIAPGQNFQFAQGFVPNFVNNTSEASFTLTNLLPTGGVGFSGSQHLATVTINTTSFAGVSGIPVTFVGNGATAVFQPAPAGQLPTAYAGTVLSNGSLNVVPEPSSMALVGLGSLGLVCFRRRRA